MHFPRKGGERGGEKREGVGEKMMKKGEHRVGEEESGDETIYFWL